MPDAITLWRWVGVLAPCGAALALEREFTIDVAEHEAFVTGHAVAGGVHALIQAGNQCENQTMNPSSAANQITAPSTNTHSGHLRVMA